MNAIVPIRPGSFSPQQLNLIRRTVARDCNDAEFDFFITVAKQAGLDPFRKQIHAIVFQKEAPDARRMVAITAIDGMRAIASRSRRYRPDEEEPTYSYRKALKGPLNPLGLVKASVKIYIQDEGGQGCWRPVSGVAYWDEFAPIKEEWAQDDRTGRWAPTGEPSLDGSWAKMGRVMLAKCAEAQALRKAFPEDLSSLYERAELDQACARDSSPSDLALQAATIDRLARIGGANAILFQLAPSLPLEHIAMGQLADRVLATVRDYQQIDQLDWFESVNAAGLRDFWARSKIDALALKTELEAARRRLTTKDQPHISASACGEVLRAAE